MSIKSKTKIVCISIVLLTLCFWLISVYWSTEPKNIDLKAALAKHVTSENQQKVTGSLTTSTLIEIINVITEKQGGFISNDISLPGVLMDNMPNWEYGALVQVRDLVRSMRDNISRSQSQSQEDKDLMKAESRLNISHKSWAMPDAKDEYQLAAWHLQSYLARLSEVDQKQAQFYARADNLSFWLALVEVRLGSLSQRLTASVGRKRLNTDLSGDTAAKQSTPNSKEEFIKTPWLLIDDVFYESRGSTWALVQLLRAIEVDFADVLENKNAKVSLAQIIRELEATQQSILSPWVLNGSGFGLFANYSLVMASYISRANAGIIDLRDLLQRG